MGWESWTSEEQRKNELCCDFKDLLPKATDLQDMPADTPEALLDERLQDLQEIWTRRESPRQITCATYLAVDEALHTEPVYLKDILQTPSTTTPSSTTIHSDDDEESFIAFEGVAAYSHSFLHEKLDKGC